VSEPLNKTDSRVTALSEVKAAVVSYDPSVGEYYVTVDSGNEIVRGARRRTFAELRAAGLIEPTSRSQVSTVELTTAGADLGQDWEID
jgi:hypothetical protein